MSISSRIQITDSFSSMEETSPPQKARPVSSAPAGSSEGKQADRAEDQRRSSSSGRERLKRHREEVAGRVSVPEKWGMEDLMSDWIDYSSFDKLLAPAGIRSAREALVLEAHRRRQATAASPRLTGIESRC